MKSINLSTFPANNYLDLYLFIMKQSGPVYKLIIPRRKEITETGEPFKNCMEFGCAAYAAHKINEVCSCFSYIVPSPWKLQPFEFVIESTDPEKFADQVFLLLCAYHDQFAVWQQDNFYYDASCYFRRAVAAGNIAQMPAAGLLAIAQQQLQLMGV